MNSRLKFYRVVAAASLGAVLWAACSTPESRVSNISPAKVPDPTVSEHGPGDGIKSTETTDVVTHVLRMQRGVEPATPAMHPASAHVDMRAPFDVRSYRNDLAEETCRRL